MPKVSVIVPIYNVEKYIAQCARSLFKQTLDDVEYIFIDEWAKILNTIHYEVACGLRVRLPRVYTR